MPWRVKLVQLFDLNFFFFSKGNRLHKVFTQGQKCKQSQKMSVTTNFVKMAILCKLHYELSGTHDFDEVSSNSSKHTRLGGNDGFDEFLSNCLKEAKFPYRK